MSRHGYSRAITAGLLAVVLAAIFAWWAPSHELTGQAQPSEARAPHPSPQPPSAEPDRVELDGASSDPSCGEEVLEASALARETADACRDVFAREGLCPEPVPFPPGATPDDRARQMEAELRACGLSAGEFLIDCTEFPCLTAMSRGAIERHGSCGPVRKLAQQGVTADDVVEVAGLEWASWVPTLNAPAEPGLYSRVEARVPARLAAVGRRLVALTDVPGSRLSVDCDAVERALEELRSSRACDALREYWGCPPSPGPVSEETYAQYASFAEQIVDDLLETCPHRNQENTFLDCSSVPCLIVAHLDEETAGEAFCRTPELFSFTGSGLVPEIRIAVAYLHKYPERESGVRERFERESTLRVAEHVWGAHGDEPAPRAPMSGGE